MAEETIVLFIPLDTSILDNPDMFADKNLLLSQSNIPLAANSEEFEYYNLNNKYDPTDIQQNEPLIAKTNHIEPVKQIHDFSNVYIQLKQCNSQLEWATSTNLCCLNCCHKFTTVPWYLPVHYINNVFIVIPIFCSSGCTLRYNIDSGNSDWNKRQSLFYLMYNKIYNQNVTKIPLAPQTILLDDYGGPFTIEQYRDYSDKKQLDTIDVIYPEIYSIVPTINLIKQQKNTSNVEYKLKRDKPIVRKHNSILTTLVSKKK